MTILSQLVKYLVIFHADPCNKSYIYLESEEEGTDDNENGSYDEEEFLEDNEDETTEEGDSSMEEFLEDNEGETREESASSNEMSESEEVEESQTIF